MNPSPRTTGRCPVAPSADLDAWTLRSHAHVVLAAEDPGTFSSEVSRHLQIPNGLDGDEHASWRPFIESWFSASRMSEIEGVLAQAATELVAQAAEADSFDAVSGLGSHFAVRATCLWLGWPLSVEEELLAWMARNVEATRSGEYARTAAVAEEFDRFITRMVTTGPPEGRTTVTSELVSSTHEGRPLTHEEVVSILRNWTAGDLSSVALCVGVVLQCLADRPDIQAEMRRRCDDDAALDRGIDEILRIDDPFVVNRRVATKDVELGGATITEGSRVLLDWTAANRDPDRFGGDEGVERFRPEDNADDNVVYGRGPHVCPGRPLATLELRLLVRAVLETSTVLESAGTPVRSEPPLGGWASAPLRMRS